MKNNLPNGLSNEPQIKAVITAVSPELWEIIEMLGDEGRARHNLKAIKRIVSKVSEVPYGNLSYTLRNHNGFITDVTWQSFERERFDINSHIKNLDNKSKK